MKMRYKKTVKTVHKRIFFQATHDLSRGLLRQNCTSNRFNGLKNNFTQRVQFYNNYFEFFAVIVFFFN